MNTMKLLKPLVAAVGLTAALSSAQAATVQCPGALGSGLNRYIQVTGALAGGECYYKEGNFQGNNVSAYLGMDYEFIEKDSPNDDNPSAGGAEGYLFYSTTSTARTSGSWTMSSNLWADYAEIFIGFHFGNGQGSPDSFLVELQPGELTGLWQLIAGQSGGLNALSNIYLFGRGEGDGGGDDDETVPEPGSLALLGLALLGAGAARRRRAA